MIFVPSTGDSFPPVLHAQIRLVEARRADVAALVEPGGEPDENLVDDIADDLVGVRLVIRAALAVPPPGGISGASREALELREREAAELLRVVLSASSAR